MYSEKIKENMSLEIDRINQSMSDLKESTKNLPDMLQTDIYNLHGELGKEISSLQQKLHTEEALENTTAIRKSMSAVATVSTHTHIINTLQTTGTSASFLNALKNEIVRIGKNVNEMINDSSRSMGNKLFTCMKSVVSSCLSAVAGACKGIRQGYIENKGFLNTMGGVIKGGISGTALGAARGAADAFMKDEERARKKIADLRKEHEDERQTLSGKGESDPAYYANKARLEILNEEEEYLLELEKNLDNPTTAAETTRKLRILSLASAGSALMHTVLEIVHDAKSADIHSLKDLGKAVIRAARNFNTILDDSSASMPSKLFSLTKAFSAAAVTGIKGYFRGISEGFKEGKGFSAISHSIKGALFGGFSGLITGFNSAVDHDLAAKQNTGNQAIHEENVNNINLENLINKGEWQKNYQTMLNKILTDDEAMAQALIDRESVEISIMKDNEQQWVALENKYVPIDRIVPLINSLPSESVRINNKNKQRINDKNFININLNTDVVKKIPVADRLKYDAARFCAGSMLIKELNHEFNNKLKTLGVDKTSKHWVKINEEIMILSQSMRNTFEKDCLKKAIETDQQKYKTSSSPIKSYPEENAETNDVFLRLCTKEEEHKRIAKESVEEINENEQTLSENPSLNSTQPQ